MCADWTILKNRNEDNGELKNRNEYDGELKNRVYSLRKILDSKFGKFILLKLLMLNP